jgi:hypothetical protein
MPAIIPICCGCGSIRNRSGSWDRSADYRRLLPSNRLSHGICSACVERLYPEMAAVWAERTGRSFPADPGTPIRAVSGAPSG